MNMRAIVLVAVLAIAVLGFVAWKQSTTPAQPAPEAAQQQMPPSGGDAGGMPGGAPGGMPGGAPGGMPGGTPSAVIDQSGDPGYAWKVPSKWMNQITGGGMRLATYIVPGASTGLDAECAVYYFGPGKGGGVEPNLQRWIGEFTKLDKHDMSNRDVAGVKINEVDVRGTYASHGMQAGQEQAPHENWALQGAIAETPNGDIFFKMTGPSATVGAASKDFDAMLNSMKKK
jgi:hypothetical protein